MFKMRSLMLVAAVAVVVGSCHTVARPAGSEAMTVESGTTAVGE